MENESAKSWVEEREERERQEWDHKLVQELRVEDTARYKDTEKLFLSSRLTRRPLL